MGLLLFYLKENDKKLNLLNGHLKTINEEKNKFIGIAAHDMRSPIGIIHSFSDLLIENYKENLHTEIIEILEIIKKTSKDGLVMLENLLDISMIESGNLVLKYKRQDYISFVKHQIYVNQLIAQKKEISIQLRSQHDYLLVDFDEHYLSEILNNLLSNGIKFSDRNSEITVKISMFDNNQLQTEIIDSGIGIEEKELQNLFKYFQKTSSSPTEGEKSTGLGLAISKQIIVAHHGMIGVDSSQNKGSNFFFRIPIEQN